MSKHTPGPWQVGKVSHKKQRVDIDATGPDHRLGYSRWDGLARVYGVEYEPELGSEIMLANACLISAAPDMLFALQAYEAWTDKVICTDPELAGIRNRIRAAIRKATGEA